MPYYAASTFGVLISCVTELYIYSFSTPIFGITLTSVPTFTPTPTLTPTPCVATVVIIPTEAHLITDETFTFSAYAVDASGNRVSATINWEVARGTLSIYSSETTPTSYATVDYTAPPSLSNGGGSEEIINLFGRVGGSQAATANIYLSYGSVHSIEIQPGGDLQFSGAEINFQAIVRNASGCPMPNKTVTWSTELGYLWHPTLGWVKSVSCTTDSNGVTSVDHGNFVDSDNVWYYLYAISDGVSASFHLCHITP